MKNSQKGFATPVLIAIIAAVVIGGYVAYYLSKSNQTSNPIVNLSTDTQGTTTSQTVATSSPSKTPPTPSKVPQTQANYSVSIYPDYFALIKNGKVTETISLNDDAKAALKVIPVSADVKPFIYGPDVNFDGSPDIAIFMETGYAGVNNYYDYYVFNPKTERFERDPDLMEISNPAFDQAKKQITSSYRSGPQSYSVVYTFNGTSYTKGPIITN